MMLKELAAPPEQCVGGMPHAHARSLAVVVVVVRDDSRRFSVCAKAVVPAAVETNGVEH